MNKKSIIGLLVAGVFAVGGVIILNLPTKTPASTTDTTVDSITKTSATSTVSITGQKDPNKSKSFTMAMVAMHNTQTSCWTTIGGKVYDLTTWISQHPGGASAILSLCGIDGTQAFQQQHGGQGRPERELASLLLGDLVK